MLPPLCHESMHVDATLVVIGSHWQHGGFHEASTTLWQSSSILAGLLTGPGNFLW